MTKLWSGRKVLVTGGTGFIGSFLVEYLLDHGAEVRVPLRAQNYRALSERRSEIETLEGDLRDSQYCTDLVRGVDEIIHLAASRRNEQYHHKRPSDVINDNVRMTLALLEGMKECDMHVPVTFFSSANVAPAMDAVALAKTDSVDGYVLGKAISCMLWLSAQHQRKFPLLILRPVGVYGPRDTFNEDANLVPAMMVQARDAEDTLVVRGDGEQERSFLYVEDLVNAAMTLIEHNVQGIQYVTSDQVVTVRALAEMIRDIVHPGLPITFDTSKSMVQRIIPRLPVHPILESLQWTPLADGLRKTFESWNGASVAVNA